MPPEPNTVREFDALAAALRYQTIASARWVAAAVEAAERLHRVRPFDLVYSRSLPKEAHICGYWTARRLRLPWLANLNDPWDFHVTVPEVRRTAPARS